jgi:ABC-type Zn uptake system ZnuABC Zn-binding protein ZnuA
VADQDIYLSAYEKSEKRPKQLKELIQETEKEGFRYVFIPTNGDNLSLAEKAAEFGIDAKQILKLGIGDNDFVQRFRTVTDIVNQIYLGSDEIYIRNNLEEIMTRERKALSTGR